MFKKIFLLVSLISAVLLSCYAYLYVNNNFASTTVTNKELKQAHQRSVDWLSENRTMLFATHNPALWQMVRSIVSLDPESKLSTLLLDYQQAYANQYRHHPLEFQVYGQTHTDYKRADLSDFPYYNVLFMYGFTCDKNLANLLTIEEQSQKNFCNQHHSISPACKTHQLMGFLYMRDSQCGDQHHVNAVIDALSNDIETQLWLDVRIVDVYLQRVLMLFESGNQDKIRKPWLQHVIDAQNSDGGWDDFMPLVKIGNDRYLGLGAKSVLVAKEKSNFHATVQGALITAYALQQATNH